MENSESIRDIVKESFEHDFKNFKKSLMLEGITDFKVLNREYVPYYKKPHFPKTKDINEAILNSPLAEIDPPFSKPYKDSSLCKFLEEKWPAASMVERAESLAKMIIDNADKSRPPKNSKVWAIAEANLLTSFILFTIGRDDEHDTYQFGDLLTLVKEENDMIFNGDGNASKYSVELERLIAKKPEYKFAQTYYNTFEMAPFDTIRSITGDTGTAKEDIIAFLET